MDEKIVSEGFFEFHKPGRLLWQYDSPAFFRMEYADGEASFSKTISGPQPAGEGLSQREAELAAVVSRNVMRWIALDLAAIERDYTVALMDENPLRLRFEAKKSSPGAAQNILLTFAENRLDVYEVLLEEAGGDYIRLEFSNSDHYE
jgi:hypothetical protein